MWNPREERVCAVRLLSLFTVRTPAGCKRSPPSQSSASPAASLRYGHMPTLEWFWPSLARFPCNASTTEGLPANMYMRRKTVRIFAGYAHSFLLAFAATGCPLARSGSCAWCGRRPEAPRLLDNLPARRAASSRQADFLSFGLVKAEQ